MVPFLKSFFYAGKGILAGLKKQRNIKIMLAAAAAALAWALVLRLPAGETALVVLTSTVVICLELLNTAGEKLVDILSPQYSKRYGTVKDILAGAVLAAAAGSVIVGFVIFWAPTVRLIGSLLKR